MNRAVFLDRDGTVCEDVGYLDDPSKLRLYPFAIDAIRRVNEAGMLAILVTNQSGVARGYFDEATVASVHERLVRELAAGGARIDGIYFCPHHPTEGDPPYCQTCACRKPNPGMVLEATSEHDIELSTSYVVGDKFADIELGQRVNARTVLVRTGYGAGEWEYHRAAWSRSPDHVAETLDDAVTWILRDSGKEQV